MSQYVLFSSILFTNNFPLFAKNTCVLQRFRYFMITIFLSQVILHYHHDSTLHREKIQKDAMNGYMINICKYLLVSVIQDQNKYLSRRLIDFQYFGRHTSSLNDLVYLEN
ncbi:hypothetical protein HHI36_019968 [Cryptolaemus montrouzieri]|uniref:Uncharacterized protein n=1 Tax=Cryptolaemus montrouzieri TaxID=559131 RepID=A0ABD2N9A2_9CUCU